MKKYIFILVCVIYTSTVYAQYGKYSLDSIKANSKEVNYVNNKWWYIGCSFTNSWTSFNDYTAENIFYKPSLGGVIFAEFYPIKYAGVQVGFGYTQRGTGIVLPDLYSDVTGSDADSTYKMRLRSNNFYFPIALVLKSPNLFKNFKLSASGGIAPNIVFGSHRIMHDTDAGFHLYTEKNENFSRFDLNIHTSFGFEIMAGLKTTFRLHAMAQWGLNDVYKHPSATNFSGKNVLYGIQVSLIY